MKVRLISAFLSLLFLTRMGLAQQGEGPAESPPAAPTGGKTFQDGIAQMSALQAMLEFFFMEAGVYPAELSELSAAFNYQIPKNARTVVIPRDPATGEQFVYTPAANKKSYKLRFPDPSKYGAQGSLELTSLNWGWLALRAERMRFEEMAKLSKYHMETLASAVEMFAKDNNRKFPESLDPLYPKYINRFPQDPITGKNYNYKLLGDGYLISNPNPERYGLKYFQWSSSQGMQVEVLPAGGSSTP